MKTLKAIQKQEEKLQTELRKVHLEEEKRYQEYERFLSEDYMSWLIESATSMTFPKSKDTKDNASLLLTVLEDYMAKLNIESPYHYKKGSNLTAERTIIISYHGNVGLLTNKFVYDSNSQKALNPFEIELSLKGPEDFKKSNLYIREVILLDNVITFVMDTLCDKKSKKDEITKAIETLKNRGLDINEILNLLQVNYASLANEEIKEQINKR